MRLLRHRDLSEVPSNPEERKALVLWVIEHPIWSYPLQIQIPPEGESILKELDSGDYQLREPEPHWDTTEIRAGSPTLPWELDFRYEEGQLVIRIDTGPYINLEEKGWTPPKEGWNDQNRWERTLDDRLSVEASSMEEAICQLGALVKLYYHDDGTPRADRQYQCTPQEDGSLKCLKVSEDGYCECGYDPAWAIPCCSYEQELKRRLGDLKQ